MSELYQQYGTDTKMEKEGIWYEAGNLKPEGDEKVGKPIRFLIARAGGANQAFGKALEHLTKPYKRQIQTNNLSNEIAEELYRDAFVATVLKDWQNVKDRTGKELNFNTDNARMVLKDLPDLYAALKEVAGTAALYREEVLEADLGNSGRS